MEKFKLWWAGKDKKARKRIAIIAVVGGIVLLAILSNGFTSKPDDTKATGAVASEHALAVG
jgi:hypothetical protein